MDDLAPEEKNSQPYHPETHTDTLHSPIRTMHSDMEKMFAKKQPPIFSAPVLPLPVAPTPTPQKIPPAVVRPHIVPPSFPPELQDAVRRVSMEMRERRERSKKIIYLVSTIIIFILVIGGVAYFITPKKLFPPDQNGTPAPPPPSPPVLSIPPPFFATEASRTISIAADDRAGFLQTLRETAHESQRDGTIQQLVVKIQEDEGQKEHIATPRDLFNLMLITPPAQFLNRIEPPLMIFFYYANGRGWAGFAAKTTDTDRAFRDLLTWEPSLANDFYPLLPEETTSTPTTPFEDRTYHNIDWRYLTFPAPKDTGVGYAIFPARNLIVVVTNREMLEIAIDRLLVQ